MGVRKAGGWLRWIALVLLIGCGRSGRNHPSVSASVMASASASERPSPPASSPSATPEPPLAAEPITLLNLPISAFTPVLALDDEAIYLLTPKAAYRMVPGKEQPEERVLDLGIGPALVGAGIIYWSKGAVWRVPKRGGRAQKLAPQPHQPQYFAASGDHFVWLDQPTDGRYVIQTLEGTGVRTVFAPPRWTESVVMMDDWVFFVDRESYSSWRIGGVRKAGGEPVYSSMKAGRTPSMLRVHAGEIYYYDSNLGEIRKVSPDFAREETLAKDAICSPMAVATAVYCAHFHGLWRVSKQPGKKAVPITTLGPHVTSMVASSALVAWIRDTGPEKLSVQMLPAR